MSEKKKDTRTDIFSKRRNALEIEFNQGNLDDWFKEIRDTKGMRNPRENYIYNNLPSTKKKEAESE